MNRIALITAILVVGYGGVIFGKEIKLEIPQEIGTSENGSVYTYSDYSNAPIVISWTSNEPPVYISVVTETGNTYEGAFE